MIDAANFLDVAANDLTFWSGVPCSYLGPLFATIADSEGSRFVMAANEGEAIGIAAGAWLAGCQPIVMLQNSGLGNAVNPLTSLVEPFGIPLILLIGWRGHPDEEDEPQHRVMGLHLPELLSCIGVTAAELPPDLPGARNMLTAAIDTARAERAPRAILVRKGTISGPAASPSIRERVCVAAVEDRTVEAEGVKRRQAIYAIVACLDRGDLVIASTGKGARELFETGDQPGYFYQVGSMGCASAIGLGVALHTRQRVIVLDGDGAMLMHLGNLATIAQCQPTNLVHVLLDNGIHDSTGGQGTAAPGVDFAGIAAACGYRRIVRVDGTAALQDSITGSGCNGPIFIHVRIARGSTAGLGRPTVHPREVATRFRDFIVSNQGVGQ